MRRAAAATCITSVLSMRSSVRPSVTCQYGVERRPARFADRFMRQRPAGQRPITCCPVLGRELQSGGAMKLVPQTCSLFILGIHLASAQAQAPTADLEYEPPI